MYSNETLFSCKVYFEWVIALSIPTYNVIRGMLQCVCVCHQLHVNVRQVTPCCMATIFHTRINAKVSKTVNFSLNRDAFSQAHTNMLKQVS